LDVVWVLFYFKAVAGSEAGGMQNKEKALA
jgi:hypothetical protein